MVDFQINQFEKMDPTNHHEIKIVREDTSFESPNIGHFESGKKFGMASSSG